MGTWFWLTIPLALLFVCCWAGTPLWLTLTRWRAGLSAQHAELAAETRPAPVFAQPDRAVAQQTASPLMQELLARNRSLSGYASRLSQAARRQR